MDIRNINKSMLVDQDFDIIIHLAAKAGVRPSIDQPQAYFDVNINGTLELLEFAKNRNVTQFVFASSSSVYGINESFPWSESDPDLMPISPYASSKLACEKIGFTYSHLFNIRFIALRFFTVYGPKQRPDLAISKFINRISNGLPIDVYGDGSTSRDYTYVEDIVKGIRAAMNYTASKFEIFNLGNNERHSLISLINAIGEATEKEPILVYRDDQPGDVPHTCADISKASKNLGYHPETSLKTGIANQITWSKNNQKHD
jgi:UDP-glucuronate 4-epimerase